MDRRPLVIAGMLLGIGLGGFADGILFHQILQIHNMLSAWISPDEILGAKTNMFWDGLFHALTWCVTMMGLWALWKAGCNPAVPWSGRTLVGSWFAGWGLFNLVESIIDHYILQVHHVVERLGLSIFDHLFLLSGVLFLAIGWGMIRAARAENTRVASLSRKTKGIMTWPYQPPNGSRAIRPEPSISEYTLKWPAAFPIWRDVLMKSASASLLSIRNGILKGQSKQTRRQ